MHGRAVPDAGRDLFDEFAAALDQWSWDVALLQEVPPWWPAQLATRLHAEQRTVLTSRNGLLALRRAIATRAPDLIKSNGGGANAILAREDRIVADAALRLCRLPERRWVHGAQLACGVWVANLHATAHDTAAAQRDLSTAAAASRSWAREARMPLILGGDFNLREVTAPGLRTVASRDVDHVLIGEGAEVVQAPERLERGTLSDHVPLVVGLELDLG